jgi:uncharacterized membrane protein YgcG
MRRVTSLLAAAFAAALVLSGGASALASPGHPDGIIRVGVDDFTFDSFSADYYLDTDADGRSTLKTVETFVANFPEFDQNHGMRRAIPETYDGRPTDVVLQSVTDENGVPRPVDTESDSGILLVTSRADSFVHGKQTYVFTYTQHNVTKFFANTNDDEFYWDTNGTAWAQSFGTVSARVHVPDALSESITGEAACYQGYEASTTPCEISKQRESGETVFSANASDLSAFQNMTVVVVFAPHTFVPRDDSYFGSPTGVLQALAVIAGFGAAIWAIVLRFTIYANGRGRPTIIAEYTPPKDLDLITAAVILKKTRRAAAAQFVDFAVKRTIRVVQIEAPGFFTTRSEYLLELRDATGLEGPPLQLADALFGYQLVPGTSYMMSGKDIVLSEKVRGIIQSAASSAQQHGLRKRGLLRHALLPAFISILAVIGTFSFGITLLEDSRGGWTPGLLILAAILAMLIVFGTVFRTPLSDKGAELRDHLEGLKLYIRLAEADRLQMLQSPEGAEREAISTSDPRVIVDLYEKLLPYAVLFHLEREWAEELGKYYTDTPPDWYSGSGAFNASVFASSIGSMSASAASSYSGSSSSSSSGGSGGGGSSGGGGGGGGGGGV